MLSGGDSIWVRINNDRKVWRFQIKFLSLQRFYYLNFNLYGNNEEEKNPRGGKSRFQGNNAPKERMARRKYKTNRIVESTGILQLLRNPCLTLIL